MNVLVLGARVIGPALGHELVTAFLKATFSGEERHVRRLNKVKALEKQGRTPCGEHLDRPAPDSTVLPQFPTLAAC